MAIKIPDSVAEKIITLDCRKEENVRRLKKSLMKLPFIKSEKDLETDNLERLIKRLEKKKGKIILGYIMIARIEQDENKDYIHNFNGMLKKEDSHEWITTIYALSIWELYAKTLFYMFYYIQKSKGE